MLCRSKIHGLLKDEDRIQEKTQACVHPFFGGSWSSRPNLRLGDQYGKAMTKPPRQKEKITLILPSEVMMFLQTPSFLEAHSCLLEF